MHEPKHSLYLSGSIEKSDDPDTWRKKIYRGLHKKFRVIIPDKADIPFNKTDPEYKTWMKQKFVMKDMISVSTSKYFFVKIDSAVFDGAGTISEVTTAAWLGKDIVYFLDGVKEEEMPSWMLGCLDGATPVNSIDEAIELYLKK